MNLRFLCTLLCLMAFVGVNAQGVTTATMTGFVNDNAGESLIGANVVATHTPSGTVYGTTTNIDGSYQIPGMRVGGPYTVVVTYIGYGEVSYNNIYLKLGETKRSDFAMNEDSEVLDAVEVIATAGVTGQNVGTSTQITAKEIDAMPTLDRDLNDFLRLTPQASSVGDGLSFAGINNRFNAIYVDGAVNNDVFGLSNSGTNGGQTGISPFSIDIIDQLQVVLSPYDVTLGGFAGGGINAVTKSGTNTLKGTAYYFLQNESLVGKTNQQYLEQEGLTEREAAADFTQQTYGVSLGGPIIKNKLFFFVNAEVQDDKTPSLFDFERYEQEGRYTQDDLNGLANELRERFDYDPGTFGNVNDELQGLKLFGKLDYNINNDHKLTFRHSYTRAEQFNRNASNANTINFSNNGVFFPTTTNSTALELNSRFGTKASNNLIIGYTAVRDDRDPLGQNFPTVIIDDINNGTVRFGSEAFSTANALDQNILSITDNFKIYKGAHTITLGTHNEFYDIYNLFIRQNFGQYRFNNIEEFLNGEPAYEYDRSYSLVDNITGDGSAAAAEFSALQLGLYGQDEWRVNQNFNLTFGLRLDVPIITTDPVEDTYFNETALPKMREQYDIANEVEAGSAPDGQLMWSPRIGFEFTPNLDRSTVIRGGVGIFTSRIPFVWPGAMFNNNGLSIGFANERDVTPIFRPDVNDQYEDPQFSVPSGDINLFTRDFKYPQVLRGNLAVDQNFGNGWRVSLEGIYTKTLNNVIYTNINATTEGATRWTNTPDDRLLFERDEIDESYFGVYVGSNTNEGYTYNITGSVAKDFDFGLSASLAYTFGDAFAINEGTSSQNSSQWRGQVSIDGRNNPVLGRSDFAVRHRIVGNLAYIKQWTDDGAFATSINLFYNGQSGDAYSYVVGGRNARNLNNESGSTSRNRSLAYIPASRDEINLVDYTSGGELVTADQQWEALNAYIESDASLSDSRGGYVEKNGAIAPFNHRFDLGIRQDLGANLGGGLSRFQISFDVFNVANLINKNWGVNRFVPGSNNNAFLYDFAGYEADGTTPQFEYRTLDANDNLLTDVEDASRISNFASRWQGRIGLRYIFN